MVIIYLRRSSWHVFLCASVYNTRTWRCLDDSPAAHKWGKVNDADWLCRVLLYTNGYQQNENANDAHIQTALRWSAASLSMISPLPLHFNKWQFKERLFKRFHLKNCSAHKSSKFKDKKKCKSHNRIEDKVHKQSNELQSTKKLL